MFLKMSNYNFPAVPMQSKQYRIPYFDNIRYFCQLIHRIEMRHILIHKTNTS